MPTKTEVMNDWYTRVVHHSKGHYLAAGRFQSARYWLGVPAVVLSTFVGTAVFAAMEKDASQYVQWGAATASVLAAILAGLQTFLGYSERSEKHRIAGAKYGALGRQLEVMRSSSVDPSDESLQHFMDQLDALSLESPNVPRDLYLKAGTAPTALTLKAEASSNPKR